MLSADVVLITGGTHGIGRGLAARYQAAGATVGVVGRDPARLAEAAAAGFRAFACDLADPAARERLAAEVLAAMPGLSVVVHNAGVQRRVPLAADDAPWAERQAELDLLLAAPVHLNHLLVPALVAAGRDAMVVTVTSGGAFVPQVFAPLYSASKAGLHAYTQVLRAALAGTRVRVVELIPPAVDTGLGGGTAHGVPVDAFLDDVFPRIVAGEEPEVGHGMTAAIAGLGAAELRAAFEWSAGRFATQGYAAV